MGMSRRTFTKEFKEAAVRRLELGAGIAEVAPSWSCKIGRQALEIDFLQRCLQHVEEQRKLQALTTGLVYPLSVAKTPTAIEIINFAAGLNHIDLTLIP